MKPAVFFAVTFGWVAILSVGTLCAQDRTVLFNTSDPGEFKGISNWGLDTAWYSEANVRRGAAFMGSNRVNVVRISFTPTSALVGGDLQAGEIAILNNRLNWVNQWANPTTTVCINEDSPTVDTWFKLGNGKIDPNRWAQLIEVTTRRAQESGRTVVAVAPFNEPDYSRPERLADQQTFYDTVGVLTNYPRFITNQIRISGGNTLNTDQANPWFNFLKARLGEGNTHQLAGSFNNYASFFQNVVASGDHASNDELHNVVEAMVGAEYGMQTGIWWGPAERARSEFVKVSAGQRLGYAEHRPNWTAASVYRGTNGAVQAFVGESERQALPTTYRFFSKTRDVFYDGDGPRRDYTLTTTGGPGYQTAAHHNAEKVVNITWGDDVPPPINGRYILVARHSSKVMEVASASTADGANIQQNSYGGGTNQQWDVTPMPASSGGDYSYYSVTAVHSGKAPDVFNFSFNDGGDVRQWGLPGSFPGVNQQWFLEYAGNGWFYVRSRWSGKYLEVSGSSTANGANIQQGNGRNTLNQQWRLIPVGAAVEFSPPAAPSGVIATANALSVQLTWNASTAPDLAGYTVLRATNSSGPFEIVARGLTNNAFTDKSANVPQTFYYIVKAVDRSLNTSLNYPAVSATPTCSPALVARYACDGAANDSSGNANDPIVTVGPPTYLAGKYGSAMDLNGTSQYQMLPANLLASVTNFTIALWVNWDGGSAWQRIFDFGNDTSQYMFLTPSSGNGTLRFAITTNGGGAEQMLQAAPLPVGQWQHVAITRNGNTARMYTNGVLAVSGSVTIAPASFNPALNYLGDSQYEADPLFNGRLDELFLFNYALSDTEITRLAANQPPPPVTPATLTTTFAGNVLNFSWPSNYLGCRLESNSVSLTASGNWFPVSGSASTNQWALPISAASSNVFFRLVYP